MEAKKEERVGRKRWGLGALAVVGFFLLAVVGMLAVLEWRPEQLMDTPVDGGLNSLNQAPPASLELVSWNIGYAALGKQADFFMDGGRQVRASSQSLVQENLSGICDYLGKRPADVFLFQEVDSLASRTFGIDQVKVITGILSDFFYAQALNFKVAWIPYPLLEPIGRVESGLLSLSRRRPTNALRHQLPGSYAWPKRVFHLKRCLHELRIPAPDGNDWVILHLHLSAFDPQGRMRRQQMVYLKDLMQRRHAQGHHVVVGGDWNQAFLGIVEKSFPHNAKTPTWFQKVPEDWTPSGWKWAFDPTVPTLRATNQPYVPGENFVTAVDGFLVSPGLEVLSVKTDDLGFVHSDHNPVRLRVSLSSGSDTH